MDVADYMLVVARTTTIEELEAQGKPKSQGLSLFLVDTKAKGLEKTPINIGLSEELMQFQLFFDNVEVPADHLVGQEGNGTFAMFNSLNPERILAAAICAGMAEDVLTQGRRLREGAQGLQGHADRRVPVDRAPAGRGEDRTSRR